MKKQWIVGMLSIVTVAIMLSGCQKKAQTVEPEMTQECITTETETEIDSVPVAKEEVIPEEVVQNKTKGAWPGYFDVEGCKLVPGMTVQEILDQGYDVRFSFYAGGIGCDDEYYVEPNMEDEDSTPIVIYKTRPDGESVKIEVTAYITNPYPYAIRATECVIVSIWDIDDDLKQQRLDDEGYIYLTLDDAEAYFGSDKYKINEYGNGEVDCGDYIIQADVWGSERITMTSAELKDETYGEQYKRYYELREDVPIEEELFTFKCGINEYELNIAEGNFYDIEADCVGQNVTELTMKYDMDGYECYFTIESFAFDNEMGAFEKLDYTNIYTDENGYQYAEDKLTSYPVYNYRHEGNICVKAHLAGKELYDGWHEDAFAHVRENLKLVKSDYQIASSGLGVVEKNEKIVATQPIGTRKFNGWVDLSWMCLSDRLGYTVKPGITVKDVCTQGLYAVAFEQDDDTSMASMEDVKTAYETWKIPAGENRIVEFYDARYKDITQEGYFAGRVIAVNTSDKECSIDDLYIVKIRNDITKYFIASSRWDDEQSLIEGLGEPKYTFDAVKEEDSEYSYKQYFWEIEKDLYVTGATVIYEDGRVSVESDSFCYFYLAYDAIDEDPYGRNTYHKGVKEQFYQALGNGETVDNCIAENCMEDESKEEESTSVAVQLEIQEEEKEKTTTDANATDNEQKKVTYARIDSEYGSYLFAVTSVKIISSVDDEKVYQISWEYENIDFGVNNNSYVELPAEALVVTDSDGYKVTERRTFQEGETLNREGIKLYAGEKAKAYSVYNINNESCEYLTIGIDVRMDESKQKVYIEK